VFVRVNRVTDNKDPPASKPRRTPRHRVGRARPRQCRGNRRSADLARPPYNPCSRGHSRRSLSSQNRLRVLVMCSDEGAARRPPPHSDLKVSAAAVDDESCQDNEKDNCGGDRPPVIFAPPWVRPPAVVAAGRTTSIFKLWVYHFRVPR
jgi:hypothetical protein